MEIRILTNNLKGYSKGQIIDLSLFKGSGKIGLGSRYLVIVITAPFLAPLMRHLYHLSSPHLFSILTRLAYLALVITR